MVNVLLHTVCTHILLFAIIQMNHVSVLNWQ